MSGLEPTLDTMGVAEAKRKSRRLVGLETEAQKRREPRRMTLPDEVGEQFTHAEKGPMRLPKFWHDSGRWNDLVISLCIVLALGFWGLLAWQFGSFRWAVTGVLLAPLTGFVFGILLVHVLCTYFNSKDV
jgi:hypothetical protein